MATTPIRNLRVPDDEWSRWKTEATKAGMSLTAWVRGRCGGQLTKRPPTNVDPADSAKSGGPICQHPHKERGSSGLTVCKDCKKPVR